MFFLFSFFNFRSNGVPWCIRAKLGAWDLEEKLTLGIWNNYKDGWEVRQRAVSVDKERFEQVEIQERLQPVLTPRPCLSVFHPHTFRKLMLSIFQGQEESPHCGSLPAGDKVGSSSIVKKRVERDLGYTGKKSLAIQISLDSTITEEVASAKHIYLDSLIAREFPVCFIKPQFTCWLDS